MVCCEQKDVKDPVEGDLVRLGLRTAGNSILNVKFRKLC